MFSYRFVGLLVWSVMIISWWRPTDDLDLQQLFNYSKLSIIAHLKCRHFNFMRFKLVHINQSHEKTKGKYLKMCYFIIRNVNRKQFLSYLAKSENLRVAKCRLNSLHQLKWNILILLFVSFLYFALKLFVISRDMCLMIEWVHNDLSKNRKSDPVEHVKFVICYMPDLIFFYSLHCISKKWFSI